MAQENQNRFKRWLASLAEKHHLTIINEESFEELYSRRTSKGRFLITIILAFLSTFIVCFLVISFTPIKKIVPGFESDEMHQELISMQLELDNLKEEVKGKIAYGNALDTILSSTDIRIADLSLETDDESVQQNKVMQSDDSVEEQPSSSTISETNSEENVGSVKKTFSKREELKFYRDYHFFIPVKGLVSQGFNPSEKHYGIDIVTKKNEAVKATLDGTVISTNWTLNEGNLIAVQHSDQLISFYKHNSVVLKKTGDIVKAGEVIAIVGNSGEMSSGPHLHFEIWKDGSPVDPADLMVIK